MTRILVVDDEWLNRQLLEAILMMHGYEVVLANSGTRALKLVETEVFDAAVVDVRMPQMGGYELVGKLRAHPATESIPIILVSGVETEADARDNVNAVLDRDDLSDELPRQLELLLQPGD